MATNHKAAARKAKAPAKTPAAAGKAAGKAKRPTSRPSKAGTTAAPARGTVTPTKTAAKMASKATAKPLEKAKAGAAAPPLRTASRKAAAAKPASAKIAAAKPVFSKTVSSKPVSSKPVSSKPVAVSPAAGKPGAAKPVDAKLVNAKPVAAKPAAGTAAVPAGAAAKPAGGTPVHVKSAAEKLAAVRAAVAAKSEIKARPPVAPVAVAAVAAPKPFVPGGPRPGPSFSAGRPGFPPGSGPITKPMPKPQGGKHFGFKALEYIVYPAHGVGQIVAIEEQQVAGYSLELFVVNFAKDKLTLKVPAPKVAQGAIRKLADAALVQRSLDCLTGRARIKRTMWSRRAQEYEAKINSGDLIAIAEVVRDLYRSDAQPEQSYSERQLFEAAVDRMAREIAAVQKLTDTEALKVLDNQLQKGPRRNAKTDAPAGAEAGSNDTDVEEAA